MAQNFSYMAKHNGLKATVPFFKPIVQPKLTMPPAYDYYEKETDTVAEKVMRMHARENMFFSPASTLVQRKCAKCQEEEKVQMKAETHPAGGIMGPPAMLDALNSGGQALDATTKSFMESRLEYDFSNVQVHNDSMAHQSAAGINALAYTHGNHVVFGAGHYQPGTANGQKLLAHELTHVIQQDKAGQSEVIQRVATPPVAVPRGANPGDCMLPLCHALNIARPPRNASAARRMTDNWLRGTLACLHTHAPHSNASHQQDIVQNEENELMDAAVNSRSFFAAVRPNAIGLNDFIEDLRSVCATKQREIGIEFRYNVILDNSSVAWGLSPGSDWNAIEAAFATLPPEATWQNPTLLTFKREHVNADDAGTKGLTMPPGNITIYDSAFSSAPYSRSRAIGIPSTTQTIQHEIGHVMASQIPGPDYNDFFDNMLHWKHYSLYWIGNSRNQNAERTTLLSETGMTARQLDVWLGALPSKTRVNRANRSYYRQEFFLEAYDLNQVPTIRDFEYAASDRGDYMAELYTFCVSNPEFVHDNLPTAQIEWLKRIVFHTPTTQSELLSLYTLPQPLQSAFIAQASRKFTWEQIEAVYQQVTAGAAAGTGAAGSTGARGSAGSTGTEREMPK